MPGVSGRDMKAFAFAKTNSWGAAASVTKGTYFESDGGLKPTPTFVEDRSFGQAWIGPSEAGDYAPPDLTLSGQARFADYNYILEALAMGSPATVAISNSSAAGGPTSWSHVLDLAPGVDGLFITFACDRKLYIEEITSAKIYGWTESVGDAGVINQAFRVLGSKSTNISSININSTVYGATYPALGGKIFRRMGVFRMNLQSGGALGPSDVQPDVEQVEFTFERPLDRTNVFNQDYIVEPTDNDFPLPSMRVTYARCNTVSANSLYAAIRTSTAMKADLTYTSATYINSVDRFSKLYQMPHCELQDFQTPTAGAGVVKPVAMWMLKLPAAAPTGMTGVVNPFRITRIMATSVHAFA